MLQALTVAWLIDNKRRTEHRAPEIDGFECRTHAPMHPEQAQVWVCENSVLWDETLEKNGDAAR